MSATKQDRRAEGQSHCPRAEAAAFDVMACSTSLFQDIFDLMPIACLQDLGLVSPWAQLCIIGIPLRFFALGLLVLFLSRGIEEQSP